MRQFLMAALISALAASSPAQEMLERQRREEARTHYRAGEEYMLSEAFEKAAGEFKTATEMDPAFTLAFYGLGQARMALKQYPAAVDAYTACKETILRETSLDRHAKADLDRRRRDEVREMEETLARMRTAVIRGGGTESTQGAQVALEQRISVLKEQLSRGDHPAQQIPAEVSLGLGSAYFRQNQLEPAEQNYRAAIGANGKLGAAHNNLAVILMLSGRLDEAEREIKAAEKAGFTVSAKFKEDLKQRLGTKKP